MGQLVAHVPSGLSLTPPHEIIKKSLQLHKLGLYTIGEVSKLAYLVVIFGLY
jgi:hypothetical protein